MLVLFSSINKIAYLGKSAAAAAAAAAAVAAAAAAAAVSFFWYKFSVVHFNFLVVWTYICHDTLSTGISSGRNLRCISCQGAYSHCELVLEEAPLLLLNSLKTELRCRNKNCVLLHQRKKMHGMNNTKVCSVFVHNCYWTFRNGCWQCWRKCKFWLFSYRHRWILLCKLDNQTVESTACRGARDFPL